VHLDQRVKIGGHWYFQQRTLVVGWIDGRLPDIR
jgi:hypothetical protein